MRNIDPNKAVDFLLEHAEKYAKAKANRIQIEEFRKSKKALLMNQCSAETVNAREQYAYSHSEYIQLIEGLKEAVEIEESLKWKMTAAQMRVEIWRSMESTARLQDRATK
jgi:hypothetical protein